MSSEWIGKIITCERCGAEARLEWLRKHVLDGGFTMDEAFEPAPDHWEHHRETGWLCEDCEKEYRKMLTEFLRGADNE